MKQLSNTLVPRMQNLTMNTIFEEEDSEDTSDEFRNHSVEVRYMTADEAYKPQGLVILHPIPKLPRSSRRILLLILATLLVLVVAVSVSFGLLGLIPLSNDFERIPTPTSVPTTQPQALWTTPAPTSEEYHPVTTSYPSSITAGPTTSTPTLEPTSTPSPTGPPPYSDINHTVQSFPETVVLEPNRVLERGRNVSSPSGVYKVGLTTTDGRLVLWKDDQELWSAGDGNGFRAYLQSDGNFLLRDLNHTVEWSSRTYGNPGAQVVIDDGGRLAVVAPKEKDSEARTTLWVEGVPRGSYEGANRSQTSFLQFPVRGTFYYPWYPDTWIVGGKYPHYTPEYGYYSSSNRTIIKSHLEAMDYGNIQLAIASWWGPGTNLDRARLELLMDQSVMSQIGLKWTVYYEDEAENQPSVLEISADLEYLKRWFAWHPAWAHSDDGRPVIFVYNRDGCDIVERWVQAGQLMGWYVVLKVFPGYGYCWTQPDGWHQYGMGTTQYPGKSFTVSPGFWRADEEVARVSRSNRTSWCRTIQEMVDSRAPWQLIVSFNEAGEGTFIEPSPSWASDESPYGYYLDCLHNII